MTHKDIDLAMSCKNIVLYEYLCVSYSIQMTLYQACVVMSCESTLLPCLYII